LKNTSYFISKSEEYESTLSELQDMMSASGITSAGFPFHQSIIQLSQELQELRISISPKLIKLQSYNQLPPDFSLAKLKIEETRKQLKELEEQLSSMINQFL